MPNESLDRNLGFLLHDVARLMRKRFDQRARAIGLSRAQCSVLAHLARHEGIRQSALAEILEVQPITLARLLDRLGERGWIERRPDPTDRRARLPHLTAQARPILARIFELGAATREDALAGIPPSDRDRLIETLLSMKRNLSARTRLDAPEAVLDEAVNG
jgi:MarR family transcriptional regulator for hemolysin